MGLYQEPVPNDTLISAFTRHWNRLNYDNYPSNAAQTYKPSYCMNGLSHVVRSESRGSILTWITFSYQVGEDDGIVGEDPWFCSFN